eukprot:768725-Hanusia_phi.AAC.4
MLTTKAGESLWSSGCRVLQRRVTESLGPAGPGGLSCPPLLGTSWPTQPWPLSAQRAAADFCAH